MAKSAKRPKKNTDVESKTVTSEPKFPYTITPNSLRKFLKLVPDKPRPTSVNHALLKSWGLLDTNAHSVIRVLKKVGLVKENNEPSDDYTTFMDPKAGPAMLGVRIRSVYAPLFQASKSPHKDDDPDLRRLFNIHSGGSAATLNYQIATLRVLAEFATFETDVVNAATLQPLSTGKNAFVPQADRGAGGEAAGSTRPHCVTHDTAEPFRRPAHTGGPHLDQSR